MGRGRALEVLLGADDIRGDLAELYGYVNRALPDAELDAFVEALAVRIASFDKQAIAETERTLRCCKPAVRRGNCTGVGCIYDFCQPPCQPDEDKSLDGPWFPCSRRC